MLLRLGPILAVGTTGNVALQAPLQLTRNLVVEEFKKILGKLRARALPRTVFAV